MSFPNPPVPREKITPSTTRTKIPSAAMMIVLMGKPWPSLFLYNMSHTSNEKNRVVLVTRVEELFHSI